MNCWPSFDGSIDGGDSRVYSQVEGTPVIAISSKSQSFGAIAKYLVAGRSGDESDRVAWTTSRNLPTADPELAGKIMRATAQLSDRVTRPVYHLALSFDPHDVVDRAAIERVADEVLHRLGLHDYQVVIVAHRDRAHAHAHLLVNRVHPETGRVWERSYDYRMIQQVLREQERALGLREVPGRLVQSPDSPPLERTAGTTREALHRPELLTPVEELRRDLGAYEQVVALDRARLEAETAAQVARVRADELSVAVAQAERAAASFDRALAQVYRDPERARMAFLHIAREAGIRQAAHGLAMEPEHFGVLLTVERSRLGGLLTAQDATKARVAARAAAERGWDAFEAEQALWRLVADARVRRLEDAFARELAMAYHHPDEALVRFGQWTAEHGVEYAASILRERPESLGTLGTTGGGRDDTTARAHARLAADLAMGVEQARREIGGRDATTSPAAELDAAKAEVERAQTHVGAVRAEAQAHPRRHDIERRIARAVPRLAPGELQHLHTVLTAPQLALMQQLKAAMREVLLDREQGREQ
ncbi:MAG TPA: relaxase/mobilization nuclease domain-containing protein [Gemmatimonadaceae bacterium]|nr:relaxase/mobilization nuclease domain-containing protein [Gemmatimonadaceae bacterium]